MVGLIVLVVIALYFILALSAVIIVAVKVKGWKWPIFTLLVFILIPTADVIVGNIYFKSVCNKHSGTFVYKRVGIGDEYYLQPDEEDISRWITKLDFLTKDNGQKINREKFSQRYLFEFNMPETYSKKLNISKRVKPIIDRNTNETLSEIIKFSYGGGWVENIYKVTGSGRSCPKGKPSLLMLAQKTFYIETE